MPRPATAYLVAQPSAGCDTTTNRREEITQKYTRYETRTFSHIMNVVSRRTAGEFSGERLSLFR